MLRKKQLRWLLFGLLILLEVLVVWPKLFYPVWGLINLGIIWAVLKGLKLEIGQKIKNNFFILPLLFINGAILYSSLIPEDRIINFLFIQVLFVLILYFLWQYLKRLSHWLTQPKTDERLENFCNLFSFLTLFFIASGLYGLQLFLDLSYWILVLVLVLGATGLAQQDFWLARFEIKQYRLFLILLPFLLLQVAWGLYFLPFDYNVLGLILVIVYYLLTNLFKLYLRTELSRKNVRQILFFGLGLIVLLLLLVRWR